MRINVAFMWVQTEFKDFLDKKSLFLGTFCVHFQDCVIAVCFVNVKNHYEIVFKINFLYIKKGNKT